MIDDQTREGMLPMAIDAEANAAYVLRKLNGRLALYRVERDWYPLVEEIMAGGDRKPVTRARKELQDSILSSAEIFSAKKFFLSDEFSLVDCTIAPILWRLPALDIQVPPQARPIQKYMDEVFSRPSFQLSLTELEQELHSAQQHGMELKAQIDRWNAEAARWEAQMKQAQGRAREEYARQLNEVQGRRDEMLYQMKLLQNASAEAWSDMRRGAEQAWKDMQQAFEQARSHFEKK